MNPNLDKIDDAVIALLHLTSFTEGSDKFPITSAWKNYDWETMDRLHKKGLISNPKNKDKSIVFTEEGRRQVADLFRKLFCDEP